MTRQSASCSTAPQTHLSPRVGVSRRQGGLLAVIVDRLVDWQERARSRVLLGRMDDRMLRDMGVTRADVDLEVTKPFWRA